MLNEVYTIYTLTPSCIFVFINLYYFLQTEDYLSDFNKTTYDERAAAESLISISRGARCRSDIIPAVFQNASRSSVPVEENPWTTHWKKEVANCFVVSVFSYTLKKCLKIRLTAKGLGFRFI